MQTLQVSRRVITTFGMCPLPSGSDFCSKIAQIVTMTVAMTLLVHLDLFSVFYVWQHLKVNDIEGSTFALMQVIAIFSAIASFVSLIFHRKSVSHYFDRIQSIVDYCKLGTTTNDWISFEHHIFAFPSNFQINLLHR